MPRAKTAQVRKMLTEGVKSRQELLNITESGEDHPRLRSLGIQAEAERAVMEAVLKALDGDLSALDALTRKEP